MLVKLRRKFLAWLRETDDIKEAEVDFGIDLPKQRNSTWGTIAKVRMKNSSTVSVSHSEIDSRGTAFTMYPARGGIVIQTVTYDEHTDRNITSLHVIPEDEDLDVALANIITIESLKK